MLLIHIEYVVKIRKSQSYKFRYLIVKKKMLHMTHFLKLLDMMCKDEMDPASIVEDTEPTRFRPSLLTHTSHRLNELTANVILLWDLWWFL